MFPTIINSRGPRPKLTDPVFSLSEARMLAPELLRGTEQATCRLSRRRLNIAINSKFYNFKNIVIITE